MGNWDVMEGVLDQIFVSLGIESNDGGIQRPLLMTEPVANLGYSRKSRFVLGLLEMLLLTPRSHE